MRRMTSLLLTIGTVTLIAASALAGAEVGTKAPDFTLKDTDGKEHSLYEYLDDCKFVVLEWFNPDCPFIKKHHANHQTMNELAAAYGDTTVQWLAINSGAPGKEGAGLERNQKAVKEYKIPYPVLLDESGEVGNAYGAKTTPHMFIIASDGTVAYAGAIDDDRSADKLGNTNYVADALAELTKGKAVSVPDSRPYGCSVKYAN
jgi:peroxiredoxin